MDFPVTISLLPNLLRCRPVFSITELKNPGRDAMHPASRVALPVCDEITEEIGAGDRDRTGDIQLGKLAFYR